MHENICEMQPHTLKFMKDEAGPEQFSQKLKTTIYKVNKGAKKHSWYSGNEKSSKSTVDG